MYLDFTGRFEPNDLNAVEQRRVADHFAELLNQNGFFATTRKTAPFDVVVDLRPFTSPDRHAITSTDAVAALTAVGVCVSQDQRTAVSRSTTFLLNPLRYASACLNPETCAKVTRGLSALFYDAETFADWAPGQTEPVGATRFPWDALVSAEHRFREVAGLVDGAGAFPDWRRSAPVFAGPALAALDRVTGARVLDIAPGETRRAPLLYPDGSLVDDATVIGLDPVDGVPRVALVCTAEGAETAALWLRVVAAGIVEIEPGDPHARIFGLTWTHLPVSSLPEPAAVPEADIDAAKPFFIGRGAMSERLRGEARPAFAEPLPEAPLRRTLLFETHKAAGAKIVPFAGWEMPVSYPAGIFAEHAATRTGAGLFDVSHMSVFDFRGEAAGRFLDALLTNRVDNLKVGRAAYQYLLRPDGVALDDAYVYRLEPRRYLLVVNAANAALDWAWINAAASGRYAVDPDRPAIAMPGPTEIRDLRDAGADSLLDIALQGPLSREILIALADDPEAATALRAMKRNDVARARVAGMELWASMTGYTGEPVGFELFVHPDHVVELWDRLIKAGAQAAGLGARDAARLEAGLPLFGHELEGALGGTLTEAGYGWVPRMSKAWFVGRNAYRDRVGPSPTRKMVRLAGTGVKTAREGHRVLGDDGAAAGVVTSFAFLNDDKDFMALAYVNAEFDDSPGRSVRLARVKGDPALEADLESKIVDMRVLSRFPTRAEIAEWRESYAKKS